MQGDKKGRKNRSRKKKSKFGLYLYAVVILLLTITNITLAFLLLTHVQRIEVSGTNIATEESIREWITEDPKTVNSIYTLFKFKTDSYEMPAYLEKVEVSLGLPWEVKVQVEEKQIVACVSYRKTYAFIDKDGFVMKLQSNLEDDVPLIEGVISQKAEQFQTLKVKEDKIFTYINNIVREVEKNEMEPDRYVWEEDSMNLYFQGICVELGKSNYGAKLAELPPILSELEGKTGVLRMEYFTETGDSISFEETLTESIEEGLETEDEEQQSVPENGEE